MRVKIKDLFLWQWKPSMVKKDLWEDALAFHWSDEKVIRELMEKWKLHGPNCRCIPPISINHDLDGLEDSFSPKALKQFAAGKWMVWNGFHRIYAARRMGYKTIRAEDY